MSQSPMTVTYSLEDVLIRLEQKIDRQFEEVNHKIDKLSEEVNHKIDKRSEEVNHKIDKLSEDVNRKIDKLDEKVDKLTVEMETVKGNLKNLDTRLCTVEKSVSKLEESNNKLSQDIAGLKDTRQVILPIMTAVIGAVVGWFIRGGKL